MEFSGQTVFLFVGFLSISAFLLRSKNDRNLSLFIAISIITLFLAIRYNWGSDYPNYKKNFDYIVNGGGMESFEINSVFAFFIQEHDVGWYTLVWLFKETSFYFFIACITIFEMIVIYISIKSFVDKKWYWLAFMILFFHPLILLLLVTTIRQYLAQILFILAAIIIERKYKTSILLMLVAVTIHMSAVYFVLIFVLTYSLSKPIPVKVYLTILIMLFFIVPFIPISTFLSFGNDKIEGYVETSGKFASLGFGVLLQVLINSVLLYYSKSLDKRSRLVVNLFAFSSFVYPITGLAPMFMRLSYYHFMFGYLAIPIIYQQSKTNKLILLGTFISLCTFLSIQLYEFFSTSIYSDGFRTYQTIFSAPDL